MPEIDSKTLQEQLGEVRLDLQTALAALFFPVKDGEERENYLFRKDHKHGYIEFACFEQLSTFDESVALAILRIAGDTARGLFLTDKPSTDDGRQLRLLLDPDEALIHQEVGMVRDTSLYEIAQLMGYKRPSSATNAQIRESLKRLSRVTISERDDREGWETHGETGFIRYKVLDNGRLSVVFARRLAMAAFGEEGWLYALVSLDERKQLGNSDVAKSVHRFLAAWCWQDKREKAQKIGLDTLCGNVWTGWDEYSDSGKTSMRATMKKALGKINSLEAWSIVVEGRGKKAMVKVVRDGSKYKTLSKQLDKSEPEAPREHV